MKKTKYIYVTTVNISKFQSKCVYIANEIRTWESAGDTSQPSASPRFVEKSKLKKIKRRRKYTCTYKFHNIPTLGTFVVTLGINYVMGVHV